MKAEIIKVFVAHETTNEYGHKGLLIGVFRTEAGAKTAADRKGWYGGMGSVEQGWAMNTDAGTYLLTSPKPIVLDCDVIKTREETKARARAKLTLEEMEALGIKP